ncbi:hypothetical protein TNCV_3746341 [Trichonephila clavipes]|nr:hypothetical protein TNCV_3746341 [Trichonephila clavipes]
MNLPTVQRHVGKNAPNYDGEVSAVCEVTTQLLAPAKVVFLIDSQALISVLISNIPVDCIHTFQCCTKIVELISYGWVVALQWVPSHVGNCSNERANQKANQGGS